MNNLKQFVECWINKRTGYVIEMWITNNDKPYLISQHIRVFWEHTGRRPKPNHNIHHIDGDKLNNDFENLQEIPQRVHQLMHRVEEQCRSDTMTD